MILSSRIPEKIDDLERMLVEDAHSQKESNDATHYSVTPTLETYVGSNVVTEINKVKIDEGMGK